MTEDQNINLVYALGALVLVASALFSRKMAWGVIWRSVLGWAAIFAVTIVLFSYRSEFNAVWMRVKSELTGAAAHRVVGNTLVIKQSDDGHFWVNASVNGKPLRLMIDSGATFTALSQEAAEATDVDLSGGGFPVSIETANGSVAAQRAQIELLEIGPIRAADLSVVVAREFGEVNVLGMNFLSELQSWQVKGDEMILEPQPL